MSNYLTTKEVAEQAKVTVKTVLNWIKSNKIPATKLGKSYRIEQKDFHDFLKRGY